MTRADAIAELASMQERIRFLNTLIEATKPAPAPENPYGCQRYDVNRACRFDRRAVSRKCDGCNRVTDRAYLQSMGLWVDGVSHKAAK